MFLTDRKLERRIAELKEYRYRDIINLNEFTVQEDTQIHGKDVIFFCGCIE